MILDNSTFVLQGRRVHHWQAGALLVAIGIALIVDDHRDFWTWVIR